MLIKGLLKVNRGSVHKDVPGGMPGGTYPHEVTNAGIPNIKTNNTNIITYGGSDVVAALATRKGVPLFTGQMSNVIKITNTNLIFIDAITDTEGVTYVFT